MKRRLKGERVTIAHVMPWGGIGGVEIATLRLVRATQDRFRHVALCLKDAADLRASFHDLGVETLDYVAPTPSIRHAARFYGESRGVARQLQAAGVDIVHFAETKAAQEASLAGLLAGCALISHVRVSHPHLSVRERLGLLPVDVFCFVSEEARQSFALALPRRKMRVIYDSVEMPVMDVASEAAVVRTELGIGAEETIIGMVARVSPQKDYFTLADAAVQVLKSHPAVRFLIVGDNSLVGLNREHYEAVKKRLDELGIFDRFIFTGHRPDVLRLTCAMDICVLSTHREGFPLSILETMSLGKPMVATSVGGIPEIVTPGVTGYLHEHKDSAGLADGLCRLIEEPQGAARIGFEARERIRTEFAVERYVAEMDRLYEDVLGRGKNLSASRGISVSAEKVKDLPS